MQKVTCKNIIIAYIVFGWFHDSFTGMEQRQAHTVQAGYQKGAEQANVEILLNVVSELVTASKLCMVICSQAMSILSMCILTYKVLE